MFSTYITFLQTTDKRNIPNNIWSTVSTQLQPQSTYRGRVEIRGEKICIFQVPSQGKSLTLSYSVVKESGRAPPILIRLGLFFHHDGICARKWPLPLCVCSVSTTMFTTDRAYGIQGVGGAWSEKRGDGALQCGVAATKRAEKYLASQDASHTWMYTFCMHVFVSVLGWANAVRKYILHFHLLYMFFFIITVI
jgi:hypothetical protein